MGATHLFGSIAQAEISQKLIRIECSKAYNLIAVSAIHTSVEERYSQEQLEKLVEYNVFLGVDFLTSVGMTHEKECDIGGHKVKVIVGFGNDFKGGFCGLDPGGTIELFIDGKRITEIENNGTPAVFDETCRSSISSIKSLVYVPSEKRIALEIRSSGEGFPDRDEVKFIELPTLAKP